jgi:hypothetical protein
MIKVLTLFVLFSEAWANQCSSMWGICMEMRPLAGSSSSTWPSTSLMGEFTSNYAENLVNG